MSIFYFFAMKVATAKLCEALRFLHLSHCTDSFCRFRIQRNSPETPSYHSQARTPPINIKTEPTTQSPFSTEDQTLLKRRNSLPQVSEIKMPGIDDTKYGGHPPLKKHRSSLSRPLSLKAEGKLLPLKIYAQEAGLSDTQKIHKEIESRNSFDPVAPLLSAKAELKIVDELKARRVRLLRAMDQKCEDDCRGEMKPCSIMLRLEIIHGGYAKSWVK